MAPVPPPATIFISPEGRIFFRTDVPYIYTDSLGNQYYEEGVPYNQNPPVGSFIIPPSNPGTPIPNPPFYNPTANRYNLAYPTGQLIFGDYLFVDYATGVISISPNSPNNGTVRQITAGPGLATVPVTGITTTGTLGLQTITTLAAGSYTYSTINVNSRGQVTLAADGNAPIVTLTGTAPVQVGGTNPNRSVSITAASTTALGAVQLSDNPYSSDTTKALTSLRGYALGQQMSYIGSGLASQKLGGVVDVTTGLLSKITPDGTTFPGIAAGAPLPTGSSTYNGLYFYTTGTGLYTPPGGVSALCVPNDKVLCVDGVWTVVQSGVRLVPATTTTYGTTILATSAEVLALTEPSKSVTPGSLSGMIASETQSGFVELATDLETQAFVDNTRAITPSNLGSLNSTTLTRGLPLLIDATDSPSVINPPTSNALTQYASSTLNETTITAKGDLVVGQSYGVPAILPLGTQESLLVVDDTKPLGLDWNVPDSLAVWPVGAIIWHLAPTAPSLWAPCDGSLYDASIGGAYYMLYDIIGTTFNLPGDPPGYFRVPDLRGMFVRGWSGANSGSAPPTTLDAGRAWASNQNTAFEQHAHNVTDPGHVMPMPLTDHTHTATITNHSHPNNGGTHSHFIGNFSVSEVVGDTASFYDGNAGVSGNNNTSSSITNVKVGTNFTNVSIDNKKSDLTVRTATTNLTVNNSPPTAPYPNESRPYNTALLPIIKYGIFDAGTGPTPAPTPAAPTYTVATTPTAASENSVVTTTIATTGISDGTTLYWSMSGTGITNAFFTSNTLSGTTTVTSNLATFSQTLAASLPAGGPYTLQVSVYADSGRTIQVGTTSLVISITPGVVPTTPLLGAYIDLWQYRNTDATYPYTVNSGWNPVVRASNIATNGLPLLDKFYLLAEVQINGADSKLYFGNPAGFPAAAQVLNSAGTGWNTNTGSPQGTYVGPGNPDYSYSAWALKNTIAYIVNQSVSTANFMLSIGGYSLSNNMDLAGASAGQASAAAAQIVTLMNLCGAKGVDIDYEPVGAPCNPGRMATLMQAIYAAVKAYNPAYEVHLTLIPSLSVADPDQKIATAVACQAYVDQLNVMTYDDPNDLSEPPYQPGNQSVFNHTGVARSVQSVQWFIDAGVDRAKLGMGLGLYARNADGTNAFSAGNPVPYNQIVAAADAVGQTSNGFPLGRFLGAAKIQNPSPTGQTDYYSPSFTALWGFDSVDTIEDKVQSASEMGLRAVFAWQISNDYANTVSPQPAGNARANFALLAAARNAITNL